MSEILDETLNHIRAYCSHSIDLFTLDQAFQNYMASDERYRERCAGCLCAESLHILDSALLENLDYYYILSFLLRATGQEEIYLSLLRMILADKSITKETKYYLYEQFTCYNFLNAALLSDAILELYDELYDQIYQCFYRELKDKCVMIPKEKRNPDLVFAFATQVLDLGHGPTKTLFDRCYVLAESLHKKVFIINTSEVLSDFQPIPFFHAITANYIEDYDQEKYLTYRNKCFGFFQCPRKMPQVSIIQDILEVISSEKPYFIIAIGSNSIVSDICGNIVPTLTIGTGQTARLKEWRPFQTVFGAVRNREDRALLEKDRVIESIFTYSFNPQTHFYSRKDLNLPEERFIVLIVGYRLDDEIDIEFLQLLYHLIESGIYIVFVGVLDKYQNILDTYPKFLNNSSFLGLQEDTLALCECCNLYLNPKRIGGGTSAAEALFKGLPVVTLDYGDVGFCAGSDFWVSDYDKMYDQVIKYSRDRQYYDMMSQKAFARAEILTDSETEFVRIIHIMEQSPRF